jgi:hypothetical protein
VVALAVGVPAMIAAIITIKAYIQSSYRHNAGKVPSQRLSQRHSDVPVGVQYVANSMTQPELALSADESLRRVVVCG